ncbi:MAG TPA: MFS transporter [Microvirga sp.]|nr:MFS transporter [Microvirga sp.]
MRTFLILLFAYTLSQFFRAFLAIVAEDLSRDLGLNAADLGAVSASWFAAFALAQFPVGYALDRFGPRRTLGAFMVLAVAGAAWLAAADGFGDALLAMALIGVGCSPILMASLYVFGRVYAPERFAMLSSLMIGLGSAGNLLGATPLAWAVQALGWRGAMAGIAAITAASLALAIAALKDPPPVERGGADAARGGLLDILSMRALWPILPLAALSYAVVIATRSLWIAPFFDQVHHYGLAERGNAALLMALTMSLGALAYGPIERILGGAKLTTLVGSVLTAGCFLALGLAGSDSAGLALALLAAIGAAGLTYGILMAHARQFFPAHLLGRGVTFMNFLFIGGAGVLQWVSGLFVQAGRGAGTPPPEVFGALFLGFGALLAAATLIYLAAPAKPRI